MNSNPSIINSIPSISPNNIINQNNQFQQPVTRLSYNSVLSKNNITNNNQQMNTNNNNNYNVNSMSNMNQNNNNEDSGLWGFKLKINMLKNYKR